MDQQPLVSQQQAHPLIVPSPERRIINIQILITKKKFQGAMRDESFLFVKVTRIQTKLRERSK